MRAKVANYAALVCCTMFLAVGQLLFKYIGLRTRGLDLKPALAMTLGGPAIYAAIFLYGTSTLLWIWVLGRVPLTRAYPWVALGVIIVPLLSRFLFAEHTTAIFWFGALLILFGIVTTQYGVRAGP